MIVTDTSMSFLKVINISEIVNPYSIETDTNMIILAGRDTNNNGIISVLDELDEWKTLILCRPESSTEACTFYDLLYHNGEWTIVGMVERIGNGFIPIKCLCYSFDSDITSSNIFVEEVIPMKSLQRIEIYNEYLYTYGGVTNQGGYVCRRLA